MTVTPSGSTTNFSGVGAPNPKLTVPSLDQVEEPMATILRTIVAWLNNLSAPTSSGGYASLTGPGETTTPGALTQLGPFTVVDTAGAILLEEDTPGGAIVLYQSQPTGEILIDSVAGVQIRATGRAIQIDNNSTTHPLSITSDDAIIISSAGGGSSGSAFTLFTNNGNPNGVVTSVAKGDLCTDNVTPGLWIATAAASTVWTAL